MMWVFVASVARLFICGYDDKISCVAALEKKSLRLSSCFSLSKIQFVIGV